MANAGVRVAAGVAAVILAIAGMASVGLIPLASVFARADAALPCHEVPGEPKPLEGLQHLAHDGAPHAPYRTVPPTSGPHSARVVTPGVYREPIAEELQVHFLEHGHVLMQYSPATPAAEVSRLELLARRHLRDVAVAPYPRLVRGIALTGWQRLLLLDRVDLSAAEEFVERVSGRYVHGWRGGAGDCLQ